MFHTTTMILAEGNNYYKFASKLYSMMTVIVIFKKLKGCLSIQKCVKTFHPKKQQLANKYLSKELKIK